MGFSFFIHHSKSVLCIESSLLYCVVGSRVYGWWIQWVFCCFKPVLSALLLFKVAPSVLQLSPALFWWDWCQQVVLGRTRHHERGRHTHTHLPKDVTREREGGGEEQRHVIPPRLPPGPAGLRCCTYIRLIVIGWPWKVKKKRSNDYPR